MLKRILYFFALLIIVASCARYRDITYVHGLGQTAADSLIKFTYTSYKIQPFDVLNIRVSSIDKEASDMFNLVSSNQSQSMSSSNSMLMGYNVDSAGYVEMPVIGKINVAGRNIYQVEDEVKLYLNKYLQSASVLVRLLSFKITFLGEVKSGGSHTISSERANMLEVFSQAGGLTSYANWHDILIMRTTPEGLRTYKIDITDKNLIKSELFFAQPSDIIYVKPLKSAAIRASLSEYSIIISAFTSILSTYLLIANLVK